MAQKQHHTKFFVVEKNLAGKNALHLASELNNMPMNEWNRMYLDCSHVKKIDATGLAVLVRLYSQLCIKGKELMLTDVPQPIQKQLTQHGLWDLFRCIPQTGYPLHSNN